MVCIKAVLFSPQLKIILSKMHFVAYIAANIATHAGKNINLCFI